MDAKTPECTAALDAFGAGIPADCTTDSPCSPCPDGYQAVIDTVYTDCDGQVVDDEGTTGWDEFEPRVKTMATNFGCGGAAHTAPALFVAVAAFANHFLA